jgi:hypothetical protein
VRNFFGLSNSYIESVYEELFLLKHYGSWSFFESYNLPIKLRRWFLSRLQKEIEETAKLHKQASRKK